MDKVLIIGAGSAIAIACARQLAGQGAAFYLLARDREKLDALAADLMVRGAFSVDSAEFDARDRRAHGALIATACNCLGTVSLVLVAHGVLPSQRDCEQDVALALESIEINALGTASVLGHVAPAMQRQRSGTIAVISSVAGQRGRQSNYIYGASKSFVSTYLQGLRNRLHGSAVRVLDIRPGFVDTPMTAGLPKGPLWAQPETVAADILKAVGRGRHTLYTPFFWRYIMWLVRLIPEPLFKRLKL